MTTPLFLAIFSEEEWKTLGPSESDYWRERMVSIGLVHDHMVIVLLGLHLKTLEHRSFGHKYAIIPFKANYPPFVYDFYKRKINKEILDICKEGSPDYNTWKFDIERKLVYPEAKCCTIL